MNNRQFIEKWVTELGLNRESLGLLEQFDDRRFRFGLYLLNQDGAAIKIRKGSIDELVIEDNVMDWFHFGHLIMLNPDDVIERAESIHLSDKLENKVEIQPYRFRGDGRDLLLLTFEPSLETDEPDDSVPVELNNMVHTMKFLFTIYATEDVLSEQGKKYKKQKMYFHDYRYQMLREKNLYYSTGKNLRVAGTHNITTTPVGQMTNRQRSKPTGEIVQDILKTSLLTSDTQDMFSTHWDMGGSSMFYTSPAQYKAIDDLYYVLDRHVSSSNYDNQPCLFRLQRFTERWELLPVTEYFSRSNSGLIPGVYQSEYFLLANESEPDPGVPPERKTFGSSIRTVDNNYHYPDVSVVNDYIFSEMNGTDCQEVMNSLVVHRYNESTKRFSMDVAEHNIVNIQNKFQELYIDHTFGGESGHGYSSWLTDSSRANNFNFDVKSSWTPDYTLSKGVGRNKSLLSAFLLGNTIQFDARGATSRRAGVWIAIDRDTNYVDSEYEMKVLGQYFVTRVTHTINSAGEYKNNVMAVKPYFYRDLSFNTDDLFMKNTNYTPEK